MGYQMILVVGSTSQAIRSFLKISSQLVVGSMQVDNANVDEGKAGDQIGIKVADRVRRGDKVYRVTA